MPFLPTYSDVITVNPDWSIQISTRQSYARKFQVIFQPISAIIVKNENKSF